ncbi:MAG: protein-L-isoaspartate O-methyltransferase, partial [Candidatus Izemoplasmatales bacterium]|nr:protein-L-isoaspartate O-methyltransferase [Candidatus Izemoplasmatales bacterium]
TGSGYQTAILSLLAKTVYTVERIESLLEKAKSILDQEGYQNICYAHKDGSTGWEEHAPYDAILVTAGAEEIPERLLKQLKPHGRLIIPVGNRSWQTLWLVMRIEERYQRQVICTCRFVPLLFGTEY